MEEIPTPQTLRSAHPALAPLIKRQTLLDVPKEARQRALLVLHAITTEAAKRGWEVKSIVNGPQARPWTHPERGSPPGRNLLSIDAGDASCIIRVRMQRRKVKHINTQAEQAAINRGSWDLPPQYDYIVTDLMRLEVRGSFTDDYVLVDTKNRRIESILGRAIDRIEQASAKARQRRNERAIAERERQEREEQLQQVQEKAMHYERWVAALDSLCEAQEHHQRRVEIVATMKRQVDHLNSDTEAPTELSEFLDWAATHLVAADPLLSSVVPSGGPPEIDHAEWIRTRRTIGK